MNSDRLVAFVATIGVAVSRLIAATESEPKSGLMSHYHASGMRSEMAKVVDYYYREIFRDSTDSLMLVTQAYELDPGHYKRNLMDEIMVTFHQSDLAVSIWTPTPLSHTESYNIIMVDSFEEFRLLDLGEATKVSDSNEFFLIIVKGRDPVEALYADMRQIFAYCWSNYLVNINVLVDNGERGIHLVTYFPFTLEGCHSMRPMLVNRNGTRVTDMPAAELFPLKISNMHNCTVTAALWSVQPFVRLPREQYRPYQFDGVEGQILHVLADKLNFSLDYVIPPNNEQRGLRSKNGTWSGAVGMLSDKKADLSLGCFRCTLERSTVLSPSITFLQTKQVLTVLSQKIPLSSFEIIFYPYGWYVWLMLLGILVGLMALVPLLRCLHERAVEYVFGEGEMSRLLIQIFGTAFGYSLTKMPQRNFARYTFTMWLLLTFVLRSAYQARLYDFFNTEKSLQPPNSIDDLVAKQYTLIVNTATYDALSALPGLRGKLNAIVMDISDYGGLAVMEESPARPYVTASPYDFMVYYVNTHKKYGVFHLVQEYLFTQQLCVYYTKNSFLVEPVDDILLRLIASGLIDYWSSKYVDDASLKTKGKLKDYRSRALTMGQLYFPFMMHCVLLIVAACIFLLELAHHKIRLLMK